MKTLKEVKMLFKGRFPGVSAFYSVLKEMPESEQREYINSCYWLSLHEWDQVNKTYRTFLTNLVRHNKDEFILYICEHTIVGRLRYPLEELVWMLAWIEKQEREMQHTGQMKKKNSFSRRKMIFSALLGFYDKRKIKTIHNLMTLELTDADLL